MREKKILLIDDDSLTHKNLTRIFENTKYKMDSAVDSQEGLKKIKENEYDLVLLDIIMPDLKGRQSKEAGIELLKIVVEIKPELPVIMFSVIDEKLVEALKIGAKDYFVKDSLTSKEILEKIEELIFYKPIEKEIKNSLKSYRKINMYDLYNQIEDKELDPIKFREILKKMESKKVINIDSSYNITFTEENNKGA
jgi:DNA-binding NtrC family response regulator